MVIAGLALSFAAHAINVFNYPRYELDEGTYMSSAWAILNGQVTAYPYGYGHPPWGWMQIAGWVQLIGGFFTFGNALNTGRALMLLYALGSAWLVYLIAHRMSGRRSVGLLAMVLFSFSPLSLVYQRQVYLDNIGVFWLLLSLFLILAGKSRLSFIVPAGLAFGLALLSKEVFVVFVPVMIFALWLHTTRYQHAFGLVTFTFTVVALGSAFVLMAILKGELFPYSWHLPWDHHAHLSLFDTFAQQAQRTQNEGRFTDSWYTWTHADALFVTLGVLGPLFNVIVGWRNLNQLFLGLAALTYWAFLLRGGVILSFYIIVLIPLVALNAALAVHTMMNWTRRLVRAELVCALLIVAIAAGVVVNGVQHSGNAFTQHSTSAQTQSAIWVRNHVPRNAVVVINSYLFMDLRQPGGEGVGDGATFPYAHVYWNIAYDPELRSALLQDNWDRIDYIVADSEMLHDITTGGRPMSLIDTALQHSILRQEFRANDNDKQIVISIYQVMHKGPPP
jgi:4-amino-4-deoxy-L-arabinose transferase-like glycosyltransferase